MLGLLRHCKVDDIDNLLPVLWSVDSVTLWDEYFLLQYDVFTTEKDGSAGPLPLKVVHYTLKSCIKGAGAP